MYLESSSPKNNAYYKKFGFEAKRDIYLGGSSAGAAVAAVAAAAAAAAAAADEDSGDESPSASAPLPVALTIMVREPQKKLANSIPIKFSGNFSSKAMREKTVAVSADCLTG